MSLINTNVNLGTSTRTAAQEQQRRVAMTDAKAALVDAAWEVADDWWPDSPHTRALLKVLAAVEATLTALDQG